MKLTKKGGHYIVEGMIDGVLKKNINRKRKND